MRKKKPQLPSIKILGRLEKGGVHVLKLLNWNNVEYLSDALDAWYKIFDQKRLDITILVLSPDMELLDGRKLKKYQEDPPAEGAGSSQEHHFGEPDKDSQVDSDGKPVVMVTNVDGNRVPKGSDADDRWGPYGTERKKKPVNVNSNPPGEMFATP